MRGKRSAGAPEPLDVTGPDVPVPDLPRFAALALRLPAGLRARHRRGGAGASHGRGSELARPGSPLGVRADDDWGRPEFALELGPEPPAPRRRARRDAEHSDDDRHEKASHLRQVPECMIRAIATRRSAKDGRRTPCRSLGRDADTSSAVRLQARAF